MKTLLTVIFILSSTTFAMSEKVSKTSSEKSICANKTYFKDKAAIDKLLEGDKKFKKERTKTSIAR